MLIGVVISGPKPTESDIRDLAAGLASGGTLLCAIAFDGFVLAAFTTMKLGSDPMIVLYAGAAISAVFIYERIYLKRWTALEAEAKH